VFALMGDLAAHKCHMVLERRLSDISKDIYLNCDPKNPNVTSHVANNAVWALGEIALRFSACRWHTNSIAISMASFVPQILPKLLEVFCRSPPGHRHLMENLAVAFGRLAFVDCSAVASALAYILVPWFIASDCRSKWMGYVRDEFEKESSFKGICQAVSINPSSLNKEHLQALLESFVHYREPPSYLEESFKNVTNR
jgi:transportin-1